MMSSNPINVRKIFSSPTKSGIIKPISLFDDKDDAQLSSFKPSQMHRRSSGVRSSLSKPENSSYRKSSNVDHVISANASLRHRPHNSERTNRYVARVHALTSGNSWSSVSESVAHQRSGIRKASVKNSSAVDVNTVALPALAYKQSASENYMSSTNEITDLDTQPATTISGSDNKMLVKIPENILRWRLSVSGISADSPSSSRSHRLSRDVTKPVQNTLHKSSVASAQFRRYSKQTKNSQQMGDNSRRRSDKVNLPNSENCPNCDEIAFMDHGRNIGDSNNQDHMDVSRLLNRAITESRGDTVVRGDGDRFTTTCSTVSLLLFSRMLRDVNGQNPLEIELPQHVGTAEAMDLVIKWCDSLGAVGASQISVRNCLDVLEVSAFLQISQLYRHCSQFIYDLFQSVWIQLQSERYRPGSSLIKLLQRPHVIRRLCHAPCGFLAVTNSRMYLRCHVDTVHSVLSSDAVCCTSELEIWWAAVAWLSFDWDERQSFCLKLLEDVRFSQMSVEDFELLAEGKKGVRCGKIKKMRQMRDTLTLWLEHATLVNQFGAKSKQVNDWYATRNVRPHPIRCRQTRASQSAHADIDHSQMNKQALQVRHDTALRSSDSELHYHSAPIDLEDNHDTKLIRRAIDAADIASTTTLSLATQSCGSRSQKSLLPRRTTSTNRRNTPAALSSSRPNTARNNKGQSFNVLPLATQPHWSKSLTAYPNNGTANRKDVRFALSPAVPSRYKISWDMDDSCQEFCSDSNSSDSSLLCHETGENGSNTMTLLTTLSSYHNHPTMSVDALNTGNHKSDTEDVDDVYNEAAIIIQCHFRGYRQRLLYQEMKEAVITIQCHFRGYRQRLLYQQMIEAAITIQCHFRGYRQRLLYQEMKEAAITIQRYFRGYMVRLYMYELNKAAVIIQTAFRLYIQQRDGYDRKRMKRCCRTDLQLSVLSNTEQNGIILFAGFDYAHRWSKSDNNARAVYAFNRLQNVWSVAGQTPRPRQYAAAVCLRGHVYIIGGVDPSRSGARCGEHEPLRTVWTLDTRTGLWCCAPKLIHARFHHAAVVCQDEIYVIGGQGHEGVALASIEVFNAARNAWREVPPMESARLGVAATSYRNRIWVAGGMCPSRKRESSTDVTIFDPVTYIWTRSQPLLRPCCFAKLVVAASKLYIVGGVGRISESANQRQARAIQDLHVVQTISLGTVDMWDSDSGSWVHANQLHEARHSHEVVALGSDEFVVIGGLSVQKQSALCSTERYNARTQMWQHTHQPVSDLPQRLSGACAVSITTPF